jgi:hypothetical protein
MHYYSLDEEIKAAAPGRVLVHNQVRGPARRSGTRGFRCWEDDPAPQYVVCDCGWRPELGIHYKVSHGSHAASKAHLIRRIKEMIAAHPGATKREIINLMTPNLADPDAFDFAREIVARVVRDLWEKANAPSKPPRRRRS